MKRSLVVVGLALVVGLGSTAFAAGDAKAGKTVYTRACQKCHGLDGAGMPAIAKALKVELKALGSEDVQKLTDEQMAKIIKEGQGKMVKISNLTDKDVADVIAYVRTFKK
ncbi:MAG TPA: cytochrome c [Candidatus Xenobia bacterium]|nr:cytochrome c [Candidatus Xenobia bacterium]